MSVLETVSAYPSPLGKRRRFHQESKGMSYTTSTVASRSSPSVIYSSNSHKRYRRIEWNKYDRNKVNTIYSLLQKCMNDPILRKYTRVPEFKVSLSPSKQVSKGGRNVSNHHDILTKYYRTISEEGTSFERSPRVASFKAKNYKHENQYQALSSSNVVVSPEINKKPITFEERKIVPEVDRNTQLNDSAEQKALHTHYLPNEFFDCQIDDLITLITRMLSSLIAINDKLVPGSITSETTSPESNLLTRYHSRVPPGISTTTYLGRLIKFNNFKPATLLTTIYYIDLLSHHYQPFFTLNSWTVHRFLLVATMVSQKSMEDFFYTNDHYAKVGGVALGELNCLELDFLTRVEWKSLPAKQLSNGVSSIKFAKEVLDLYYHQLVELMGKASSKDDQSVYMFEFNKPEVGSVNFTKEDHDVDVDDDLYDDDVCDNLDEY